MNGPTLQDALKVVEAAVQSVSVTELPRLVGHLVYYTATANLRMSTGIHSPTPQANMETCYLTVAEVAERFHVTPKWLYRNKTRMPHSQPSRKRVIFPEQAVTKWFASRTGA